MRKRNERTWGHGTYRSSVLSTILCWTLLSLISSVGGFSTHPSTVLQTTDCQDTSLGLCSVPQIWQRANFRTARRWRRASAVRQATSVPKDFSTPQEERDIADSILKLNDKTRIPAAPSLRTEGLSKFHQSILSQSSDRQRFVTGRFPLRVTIQDTPTRRWLGIGRDRSAASAQIFVNGTTVDRSLASFDRFQWIDEGEREELVDQCTLVSLELLAEIHIKNPGYVNVLPANGAGSSAAVQRVAAEHSWNQWKRNTAVFEQIESTRWQAPYRDRVWITGFSLASSKGSLQSFDAETGHIESVGDRTTSFIRWPNESNSVPLPRYRVGGVMYDDSNERGSRTTSMEELEDALLISDGFLVPGKDKGGLYVVKYPGNQKSEWNICLTGGKAESEPWFYHRAVWVDLTGDGHKSILTARAKPPSLLKSGSRTTDSAEHSARKGQLVWLEMPKPHSVDEDTGTPLERDGTIFDPFSTRHIPWKIHVLDEGPDVMFTVADMDTSDDTVEVISSQFFGKRVTLHSIQRGPVPKVIFRRTLDNTCGAAFGSILSDLDSETLPNDPSRSKRVIVDSGSTVQTQKPGDAFSHLLVTSHECSYDDNTHADRPEVVSESDKERSGSASGSLFAYRVPGGKNAWKSEPWLRTTVASGFRVKGQIGNMINPGAPGFVYTFYPSKDGDPRRKRPLIAIAGDCAESAYIYRPSDQAEGNCSPSADSNARYKLMCEIECGATVGSIGVGYDNFCSAEQKSGYAKLYIPCYEKDKVYVFAMGDGEDDFGPENDGGW